jgi:L-ascorbate metabolism protein UlaG (beta-lactamase superfamily)
VCQIEPKVVIPVHYAQPGLSYDVPQDDIELFVNELGAPLNEFDKYKIKKVTDLEGPLQIIKLKAKI